MPNLTRRQALRATGAASLGLIAGGAGGRVNGQMGAEGPVVAQVGRGTPNTGITQSVARWCYAGIPLEPFCAAVADLGLTAMDLLKVDEWSVARDHGLTVSCGDVGAGTIEDGLNEPGNHAAIIGAIRDTGFSGYMAHEFIPRSGDPLRSLAEAVEMCAEARG